MALRVAAIGFLNAAPLMWGLERDPRFALRHTVPSACADALAAGTADLGVIPVIELVRQSGLVGLGGLGVASGSAERSCVRSILLVTRRPLEAIRTVALDPASRTSAALALILLRRRFHAQCEAVPGAADWRTTLQQAEAALLIGDPALQLRVSAAATAAGYDVRDLAREWWEWTGLPFVFAAWGIRREVWDREGPWLGLRLREALNQGLDARDTLADAWAPRLRLPHAEIRRYLSENVVYRLTPEHRAGLDRFLALAAAEGLLASPVAPLASLLEVEA